MPYRIITSLLLLTLICCKHKEQPLTEMEGLDQLAAKYVTLALTIGQYDEAFVDAYYGPDSLKPTAPVQPVFPKDSLLNAVKELSDQLKLAASTTDTVQQHRALWIADQLISFDRRIRVFSGEYGTFDEESKDLFGAVAPTYDDKYFQDLIAELDGTLPGKGTIADRFQALANRFVIPKEKLDTVFKAAIAECRKRTMAHYNLPENESFQLEFVSNKPWNGYNWYKGGYQSLIQINTDLDIFIDRAIDVGSHESYPGHHVYNMLLEKNLYRDRGLLEISVYPLYSPQSIIAEGTANYGIEVVFPGNEKTLFARDVLLPLAGLDTTGIGDYFKAMEIKTRLNYIRNEVGRKLLAGTITEEEAIRVLMEFGLYNQETAAKSISFIKSYRTYVINYNYGLDLVREYIESRGGVAHNPEKRWKLFGDLMSKEVRINQLK